MKKNATHKDSINSFFVSEAERLRFLLEQINIYA